MSTERTATATGAAGKPSLAELARRLQDVLTLRRLYRAAARQNPDTLTREELDDLLFNNDDAWQKLSDPAGGRMDLPEGWNP